MRVISKAPLQKHWRQPSREDSKAPLKAWLTEANAASWKSPTDIKNKYGNASFLADNRVIFNVGGNKYRLVVHLNYKSGVILVKFIGTHAEYDGIDAEKIGGGKK